MILLPRVVCKHFLFCTHKCYQKFSLLQKKIKQFTLYNSFSLTWVGGCLGSQPPRPFCPFHFHFLLPLTVLVFTFSFSAHSIKAKDLKLSSSNFTSTSIFNADSQSDVTGILGSLQCAIGVTGKGDPIYCENVGTDCTDGDPLTACICTDRSSATGVLPDISAFDSHLCVQDSLYHPNIKSFTDPRSRSCPAGHTAVDICDLNINVTCLVSGHADKYIRAMSYRYAAQWVKNYTPKCWVGQDDSQCPEKKPINDHKILLTDFGAGLTDIVDIKKNCCNYADSSTNITTQGISPIFGGFSVTGNSSSTYVQDINTLGSTNTCGAKLHTEISCSGFNFCTDCNSSPNNVQYDDWATSSPHGQCLCRTSGSCGAPGSCDRCQRTGSPGSYTYKCVTPSTSCSGGRTWDAIDCDCDCPSGLVWNGSSCVTCPSCSACQTCVGGTCTPQGSGGGGCPLGEVCCGGSCKNDTCTGSDIWDPSSCSCKPPPCTVHCGVCQTLDSVNCRCDTIPNCCTTDGQCPGSCNSCVGRTCTGCSGLTPACCGNTCQASCSCPTPPPKPTCSNCWETNNYSWQGYPICSWTGSCTGSQPTCPGQVWDPSSCSCESCTSNQVYCSGTCKTRKTPSDCPECQQPSSDKCNCENKPNNPPTPCSNCGTCSSGICTQNTPPPPCSGSCETWDSVNCICESTCTGNQICCGGTCKTPETIATCSAQSECQKPSSDKCSCVSKPGPCGTCGTCSGGTCSETLPCPCSPPCGDCQKCQNSSCVADPAQVDCNYESWPTTWSAWTPGTSNTCSNQTVTQTRSRSRIASPTCGASPCNDTTQTQSQTVPGTKPPSCNYGNWPATWSAWSPADISTVCVLVTVTQTRSRSRIASPTCGASPCNDTTQTQSQTVNGPRPIQCYCTSSCNNTDVNSVHYNPNAVYTLQSRTCSTPGEVIEISVCSRLPCEPCGKTLVDCSTKKKTETRTVPRPICPPGQVNNCTWQGTPVCDWFQPPGCCSEPPPCKTVNNSGQLVNAANGTACGTAGSCRTCNNGSCTAPSTTSCGFFGQTWNSTTCSCGGGSGLPASLSCHKTSLSGSQKVSELHASFTSCTCPSDYTAICLHTLPYTQLLIIFNALLSFGSGGDSGLGICEKVQSGNNDYQLCTDEDGSR